MMKRTRHLALLAVAAGVAVAAVIYTRPTADTGAGFVQGEFAPDLRGKLDRVELIDVTTGIETVRIARADGQWGVAGRAGYPADEDRVRELLLGLASLTRLEAKTRRPEQYQRMGLGEGEDATRILLTDAAGPVMDLHVGARQPAARGSMEQYYVRLEDDPQVWLVEGRLPALSESSGWLRSEIVSIDRQRIAAVEVRHLDGETVRVHRQDGTEPDFALEGLVDGETPTSAYALNAMATFFSELRLEDVRTLPEEWPPAGGVSITEMTTFDGLRLQMEATVGEAPVLARFQAEVDEGLRIEADAAAGGDLWTLEEVQEEAGRLSARFEDWVYALPAWQLDSLSKRRADLVQDAAADAGS